MISNKLVIIIKAQSSKAFIQKGKRNIKQYTENQIEEHLNDFYMIIVDEKKVGSVGYYKIDSNTILLDELFIEEKYHYFQIGTSII